MVLVVIIVGVFLNVLNSSKLNHQSDCVTDLPLTLHSAHALVSSLLALPRRDVWTTAPSSMCMLMTFPHMTRITD